MLGIDRSYILLALSLLVAMAIAWLQYGAPSGPARDQEDDSGEEEVNQLPRGLHRPRMRAGAAGARVWVFACRQFQCYR
jgi:hypothetical protein